MVVMSSWSGISEKHAFLSFRFRNDSNLRRITTVCWFQICLISTRLTNEKNWTNITIKPTILRKHVLEPFPSNWIKTNKNPRVLLGICPGLHAERSIDLGTGYGWLWPNRTDGSLSTTLLRFHRTGPRGTARKKMACVFFLGEGGRWKNHGRKPWGKFATCPCLRSLKHSPWGLKMKVFLWCLSGTVIAKLEASKSPKSKTMSLIVRIRNFHSYLWLLFDICVSSTNPGDSILL